LQETYDNRPHHMRCAISPCTRRPLPRGSPCGCHNDVEIQLRTGREELEGEYGYSYSFFNLGARWGGWPTPRPSRFTPEEETWYPLYRRLLSAPGPVWTGAESIASTGIRALDRPACTGSNEDTLCSFSWSGPQLLARAVYFLFRNRV